MSPNSSQDSELYEQFLRRFTVDQLRILTWIRTLIPDASHAADIFQETSLEMWRSFPTFRSDAPFLPWALGVARHQVLKYWREQKRDRHVFGEALLETLTRESLAMSDEWEVRRVALESCIARLSDRQRDLLRRFYGDQESAGSIAKAWGRSVHAVYKSLKVTRRALIECVTSRMGSLMDLPQPSPEQR